MTILRIPSEVAVSPEDGSQIRYDSDALWFLDREGNIWRLQEVVGSRKWNPVLKWLAENFEDRA